MTTEEIAEEIRLTISLNEHRGVAKVHDFCHSDDRYVIVVMELLRGGDLLSAVSSAATAASESGTRRGRCASSSPRCRTCTSGASRTGT